MAKDQPCGPSCTGRNVMTPIGAWRGLDPDGHGRALHTEYDTTALRVAEVGMRGPD
jgi:hypothetical protein